MYGEHSQGLPEALAQATMYGEPHDGPPFHRGLYPGQINPQFFAVRPPHILSPRLDRPLFGEAPTPDRQIYGDVPLVAGVYNGQTEVPVSENKGYGGQVEVSPPQRDMYTDPGVLPGLGRELFSGSVHLAMAGRDLYSGHHHHQEPAISERPADRELFNNGHADMSVSGRELYSSQSDHPMTERKGYNSQTDASTTKSDAPSLGQGEMSAASDREVYNGQVDLTVAGREMLYSGQNDVDMTKEMYEGQNESPRDERNAYPGQQQQQQQQPQQQQQQQQPPEQQGESSPKTDVTPPPSPLPLRHVQVRCMRCKEMIRERHLVLLNDGRFLHERCVCCEVCRRPFLQQDNKGKMFLRGDKPYCFKDYRQLYGSETKRKLPTCGKCSGQLEKGIWVRRAGEHLFHVTCFCCSKCDRQLSLNDRCVVREGRLICDKHFYEHDGSHKDESPKPRAKRMRTSFTDEQLRVLQHHFAIDSNPDGQDLERIAKATGLKKRVTQVWFQNNRARHKKTLQNKGGGGPGGGPPGGVPNSLPTSLPSSFSPPLPPHHHGNGGGGGGMVYSASEEGDSCQGADLGVYCSDPERPDENSGGGVNCGGGGGGVHAEFAAAQQSFCYYPPMEAPFRQLTERQRRLPATITSADAAEANHTSATTTTTTTATATASPLLPDMASASTAPLLPPLVLASTSRSIPWTSSYYYDMLASMGPPSSSMSASSSTPSSVLVSEPLPPSSMLASTSTPFPSSLPASTSLSSSSMVPASIFASTPLPSPSMFASTSTPLHSSGLPSTSTPSSMFASTSTPLHSSGLPSTSTPPSVFASTSTPLPSSVLPSTSTPSSMLASTSTPLPSSVLPSTSTPSSMFASTSTPLPSSVLPSTSTPLPSSMFASTSSSTPSSTLASTSTEEDIATMSGGTSGEAEAQDLYADSPAALALWYGSSPWDPFASHDWLTENP